MLHRFGMVIAIPGLIPACFAKGDSKTAQRHFGAVLINALTLVQQVGGTLALAFPAAAKHGLKLVAADWMGVFPHSPAAPARSKKACETSKHAIKVAKLVVILEAISLKFRMGLFYHKKYCDTSLDFILLIHRNVKWRTKVGGRFFTSGVVEDRWREFQICALIYKFNMSWFCCLGGLENQNALTS